MNTVTTSSSSSSKDLETYYFLNMDFRLSVRETMAGRIVLDVASFAFPTDVPLVYDDEDEPYAARDGQGRLLRLGSVLTDWQQGFQERLILGLKWPATDCQGITGVAPLFANRTII